MSEDKPKRKHRATGGKPTGRPKKEPTTTMRVDLKMVEELQAINERGSRSLKDKLRGAVLVAQLARDLAGPDATWAEVRAVLEEMKARGEGGRAANPEPRWPQPELPL